MNNNTIKIHPIIIEMGKAKTEEELKKLYHIAVKAIHPDNNNGRADSETMQTIYDCYAINITRFHNTKEEYKQHIERVEKATKRTIRIKRHFNNIGEFFACDGSEQLGYITGMVIRVATILKGALPKADSRYITDKVHADYYGNFDGIKCYAYAYYIFNKNGSVNLERAEEVAHTAWIKLAENTRKAVYSDTDVNRLLWLSCRQALKNTYYKEVEKLFWLDRKDDCFNLNAYETSAPIDWNTEETAINRITLEEMDKNQIISLVASGYNAVEIANMLGLNERTVRNIIRDIKAEYDSVRLMDSMNSKTNNGRKNESPIKRRKRLIMQAISCGMSYKRIAYNIGISELKDQNGNALTIEKQIQSMLTA